MKLVSKLMWIQEYKSTTPKKQQLLEKINKKIDNAYLIGFVQTGPPESKMNVNTNIVLPLEMKFSQRKTDHQGECNGRSVEHDHNFS